MKGFDADLKTKKINHMSVAELEMRKQVMEREESFKKKTKKHEFAWKADTTGSKYYEHICTELRRRKNDKKIDVYVDRGGGLQHAGRV